MEIDRRKRECHCLKALFGAVILLLLTVSGRAQAQLNGGFNGNRGGGGLFTMAPGLPSNAAQAGAGFGLRHVTVSAPTREHHEIARGFFAAGGIQIGGVPRVQPARTAAGFVRVQLAPPRATAVLIQQ